ncbi:universal stress protein YxiE-like [Lolium rigidum]|uniref:universal stress protein YxiE-like n=1 Tax=Lolium rigidum TaxID=89674 RepID=UPI001F5D7E50|nr:universal stress protein YxiE-like [Lolium rigidum]
MWLIEAVIARHDAGLTTDSERVAMEEERAAAAVASGVPPAGAGGAEASRVTAGATTMKVVAAVDAGEESLRALSWALDHVVRQNPGASVVVVHAQHRAEHFVYPVAAHGLAYAPPMAVDSMKKTQEENARRVVSRALEVCAQRQVTAKAAVVEGDPKEAICQAVEDMHADLLVLGSRGLGMIKRALLGSVSDYLAHHASCPVLIVKPPKAHAKGTGSST